MIAAMVTIGCAPAAWFADARHADTFADALRAAGVLGVSVVDTDTAIPEVLDRLRSVLDDLENLPGIECDGTPAPPCGCGVLAVCTESRDVNVDDPIHELREAIDALERVGA